MKNKLVMIVLGVILVLAAGAMVYAIYSTQSGKEVFAEDGYIIVYDETDTEQPAKTYHFTGGTAFKRSYEGSIQFRDTEGKTVTADANSFVHYDSGASASLSKSVLVNLDEVGSSAVNYYGLNADTSVNRSGSSYSIDTSDSSSVDLTNYLWKVGNNRYMMVSDVITVSFTDGESYTFDDYVELIYQEGGMVSIINGDTMLRDASKNTYVSTDTGIKINLATQVVLDNDNIAMTLGQMTTDSDQVVSVLPADVDELKIIIPEFKFTVFDGKDGEAGPDGANGQNGADGSVGSDGMSGDNGRTGLMGYDGDDGDAGQAGTSGRSGVNGVEGAEGVDGAQGAAGAAGPQGGQGAAGSAGSAGGAGASGPSGTDGLEGEDGDDGTDGSSVKLKDPLDVLKDVPFIYWSSPLTATYNEITGSFGFKMSVDSQATAVIKNVKVTVVDLATGKVVKTPQEITSDMTAGGTSNTANIEGFDNLAPANAYRVTITGVYDYKGKPVETVFDDRTVVTDGFPLGVNIYGVEPYAIDIELINRDANANPGDTNNTHNYVVDWVLTDAKGAYVKTGSTTLSQNFTAPSNPTVINADGTTSDHIIINTLDSTPLQADTQYYFTVQKLGGADKVPERYVRIPVKTLKRTPTISNVEVSVSIIDQSFVFSVGNVNDPDHAITGFRYEVTDMNDKVVAVVHAPDNQMVHCYVDGIDPMTGLGLDPNEFYYVRAIAEAFDNKKNIEVSCNFGTSVTMDGVTQTTWFTLNNMDRALTPNALGLGSGGVENAEFTIHLPGRATIKPQSSLIIQYHTSAIQMGSQKIDWTSFSANSGTGLSNETIYTFTCNFSNLKSSNTYKFDCLGEVDINGDGVYENKLIGSVILTTPRYVGGNVVFAGQKNNTTPVYFTLTLQADNSVSSVGTSVNTSAYSVSQAGSSSMIDGATNRGQVHVQLYTPGFNGGSDVLVCEGDFDLESDNGDAKPLSSKYTNRYITIDDFPGNASSSSFNGEYYAVVTGAYDSTSHKNPIPFTYRSDPIQVGKTYPDPSTLSLSVMPITINNYCEKVGVNALPDAVKDMNYDPRTVLGFYVTPVGVDRSIDYFSDIYFYVYDAEYYRKNMLGIEQNLKPYMLGTDTTGMTSLSDESGNAGSTTKKFYPANDTNYMTGLHIALTKNDAGAAGGFTRMDTAPSAVFLFDDFTGDEESCKTKLTTRNSGGKNAGYTVDPYVTADGENKAISFGFARGRDYEFTFRLKTDHRTMGDNYKMYPELLGPEKELVLKSNVTVLAPYEEPSYYFYPASSDANSFTYGYYVKSVDATHCLGSVVSVNSGATVTNYDKTSGSRNELYYNQDAKLTVSGARKGKYTVTTDCNLYVSGYNRSEPVVLINKFFAGEKPETVGTYKTIVGEDEKALSKVKFEITLDSEEMVQNVVALKATFYKVVNGSTVGTGKDRYLSVSSTSGRIITAYANFADLTDVADKDETVRTYLEAYYDTGHEGFLLESGTNYVYPSDFTTTEHVAIKEATSENEGQYIIPIGSSNAEFDTRRDTNTRMALGSIFKVAMDHSVAGAQGYNIKDTLTDANMTPGVINIRLRHLSNNSWGYDTAANSKAKLGGAYDFVITKNLEPYTISHVKLSNRLNSNPNSDREFKMGAVIPMVNLHSDRGFTISAGIHSATVTFKISGVKGAGTMYVHEPSTTPNYGAVYLILSKVINTPTGAIYEDIIDPTTGKLRRIKKELTNSSIVGAPGDGEYTVEVGSNDVNEFQLEPNSSYVFQMVYYATEDDYNNDLDTTTNPVTDHRLYLRDEKYPDSDPEGVYYPINTTDTVSVAENLSRVSYSAKGYNDKRLTVNVELSNTSAKVQEGVTEFRYALYDEDNNLVLTHKEIEQWIRESEIGGSVVLNVSPKTFRVGQKETSGVVKDVYLNFSANGDGAITKYKLRLIPVAISDLETFDSFMTGKNFANGVDDYSEVGNSHLKHTDDYKDAYNEWVSTYSLGNDRGYTGVSHASFVDFSTVEGLKSAFPNIRAYSAETSVMFRIGMVDTDGVVHSDKYKIRIFNSAGQDITTSEVKNQLYSSRTTQKITVSGLGVDETVTLKVYYVEDITSNKGTGISQYGDADFDNGTAEGEHINANHFKMTSATQKSTGADGFSYGVIDAVRRGSQTGAYLDFVNPSKLNTVSKMDINVALNGAIKKSITVDNPFSIDSINAGVTDLLQGDDLIYRYNGIPDGTFTDSGTYVIAIRLYTPNGNKEYVIDNYTIA